MKIFESEHRLVTSEQDYVLSISRGDVTNREAIEAAHAIIDFMLKNGGDRVLLDLTEMKWISNLSDRQLRFELVSIARAVVSRMAFVSDQLAVRAMVADLLKNAGVKELLVFKSREDALQWLLRP